MLCIEPLAAILTTVFWLKDYFGAFQWLGAACILCMICLMAVKKSSTKSMSQQVSEVKK